VRLHYRGDESVVVCNLKFEHYLQVLNTPGLGEYLQDGLFCLETGSADTALVEFLRGQTEAVRHVAVHLGLFSVGDEERRCLGDLVLGLGKL